MTDTATEIGTIAPPDAWRAIALPRIEDYFQRPEIEARLMPLSRRLTVLQAPCGFGKTTLLANACRHAQKQGNAVVWIQCGAELTFKDLMSRLIQGVGGDPRDRAFSAHPASGHADEQRFALDIGLTISAIEKSGAPCLLAFDDVECLSDAGTAKAINTLCRYGPPNLRVALAQRWNAAGLDLAAPIINGQGEMIGVEDLRFSDPEIARFVGRPLSRDELVALVRSTEGWPAALRMVGNRPRNGTGGGTPRANVQEMISRYLSTRLLRGLSDAARAFLLDLAVFDTIERPLLEASFPREHALCWPELSAALQGLIRSVDSSGDALRMHPLVRKFLQERGQSEDMNRYRRVSQRLAKNLLRNGDFGRALSHAAQADDSALCARVLEESGGVEQLFKEGLRPFVSACRHLTRELADDYPQLVPTRCVALLMAGETAEARWMYERFRTSAKALEQAAANDEKHRYRAQDTLVRAMLWAFSCQPLNDPHFTRLLSDATRYADEDRLSAIYRGAMYAVQVVADSMHGRYELGRRRASRAKELFRSAESTQGVALMHLQSGVSAMAQGRVGEAESCYSRSIVDMGEMASPLVLELRIECNDQGSRPHWDDDGQADPRQIPGWIDIRAAAHGNLAEAAFDQGGPQRALAAVEASIAWAGERDAACLTRLLSAQRVEWLVRAGDPAAASRAWAAAGLPEDLPSLLTVSRQSWREMEAIACARIALLGALGEIDAARDLAEHVRISARGWGLKRLLMRCLSSWSALEIRASNAEAASRLVHEYVREYGGTAYSRPLTREGEASVEGLRALLRQPLDDDVRSTALALLEALGAEDPAGQQTAGPKFSERELEVLDGLARGRRNKEIARGLGLTESGVRYHLKRIYGVLGASGRIDAVRRASHLGVDLSPPPRNATMTRDRSAAPSIPVAFDRTARCARSAGKPRDSSLTVSIRCPRRCPGLLPAR